MRDKKYNFDDVLSIIRRLRSDDGCPWDNEQTYGSLRKYLLEETYEALDAIDSGDFSMLCEELGDCIWEILFIARIAEQEKRFSIDDVVQVLAKKMIRRHPHIFGEAKIKDSEAVLKQWARIKLEEGKTSFTSDILDKIPKSTPALLRAYRIGERVAKVGFDWENGDQVMEKFHEEIDEFKEAMDHGNKKRMEEEFGDMLFALSQVARHLDISPEDALRNASDKFTRRFSQVEKEAKEKGQELANMSIDQLEALWKNSKKKVD